ncbi:NADP-dependent 3-hydroxy acid dehydrogenase YdfG [Chitinophaga rupis]|uniref:NADP-dependent 3-hydroxy acid dehydrogenase YdfG n=1 Tax=Chitinophaga rupis TaxID=573321 RepID=A0A1H7VAG8_9BACT|nr:oxidoreductase [Chitinophaga rupis]SEM05747.1 NADP-dependent 3-hydroxy acid dehydrogenase YdfG [Chitinophaga rupis]
MKKVVFITGASSGMGKVTARVLAQEGYIVYAAARRTEKMDDLRAAGVIPIQMDVTDETSMVNGVQYIINAQGKIDVLVNNAGFGSYGAIEDVAMSDARYQLEVNVFGAIRLAQLVLPYMRQQRQGRIINISSIGGKFAMPLGGWYHASKFALEALSDSMRNEVKQFGIDVVVIEPGGVQSEWGGIAVDHLKKVSGGTVYRPLVDGFMKLAADAENKAADPMVIAKLIRQAIEAKKPKTRYAGGYMAGVILFMRKMFSDKMLDSILLSQYKLKPATR